MGEKLASPSVPANKKAGVTLEGSVSSALYVQYRTYMRNVKEALRGDDGVDSCVEGFRGG